MRTILSRAGFNKRSGTLMSNVMFSLMLWLWLQKESYKYCLRKAWQSIRGQKCQAKIVDAEINQAENKDPEEWIKVRLLFVRGNAVDTQTTVGKHDWAVFLTTDTELSSAEILELYALRWAIEVYFKEAKQHLGFLKEQSNHYAAYISSIHLTAIRFCLLVIAKQTQGGSQYRIDVTEAVQQQHGH